MRSFLHFFKAIVKRLMRAMNRVRKKKYKFIFIIIPTQPHFFVEIDERYVGDSKYEYGLPRNKNRFNFFEVPLQTSVPKLIIFLAHSLSRQVALTRNNVRGHARFLFNCFRENHACKTHAEIILRVFFRLNTLSAGHNIFMNKKKLSK